MRSSPPRWTITKLTKVCAQPGCPELAPCPTHTPKPWATSTRRQRLGKNGWQQQADAQRILRRDRHTCQQCGSRATQADHVIPVAHGGTDTDGNKQALCEPCHNAKTKRERTRG